MNKEKVYEILSKEQYYTIEDLRHNQKIGIMFEKEELTDFLRIKEQLIDEKDPLFCSLPLKTFNSRHCFYTNSLYLLGLQNEYLHFFVDDLEINKNTLYGRNMEDMILSRLFSEVEGSLNIENVPTTHKRVAEINKTNSPVEQNDIIIKNMLDAIKYIVTEEPEFNKENLLKLYNILSNNCLPEEKKLKPGAYYRHGEVSIGKHDGADHELIDECMNSLFEFANDKNNLRLHDELLPYICHYYILYVHPYFDYNGRTARMVSFWLNHIHKIPYAPYFMSEAINESKNEYYRALDNSRFANNDLTYFLGYIMKTSIKYSFVYKNLEEMKKELAKTGDTLTSTEWVYVKKILVHNPDGYFNYKMFFDYIGATMSRAGAFKILNNFFDYGILEKSKNKKGIIIYRLNPSMITYKYN